MPSDREHLSALETAYWKEIVEYFESFPEAQRPLAYKKYAGVREIIALSQSKSTPEIPAIPAKSLTSIPKPRSLTDDATKEAIHEGVAAYFVRRNNKPSVVRDTLTDLADQGVHVPGKSPASTLAALISRDSAGRYAKAEEGYWHLSHVYYQQKAKEYQSVKAHFEKERGATSLVSAAPLVANHPH